MSGLVDEVERQLGISFPKRHLEAMSNRSDPIHNSCEFLVLTCNEQHGPSSLLKENIRLREQNNWPGWLVAFASNGCGDWFAYDLREPTKPIIYIDPSDEFQDKAIVKDSGIEQCVLQFGSFDHWYMSKVQTHAV